MPSKVKKKSLPSKGHWLGVTPSPKDYYGFVYRIKNNINGLLYIGRKVYWVKKRGMKGCKSTPTTDRQSEKWKEECYRESDWRTYTGSSKHLTKDIKKYGKENFTFEILCNCRSKGTLYYREIEAIIKAGAMTKLSKEGEDGYLYYNRHTDRIRFKVHPVYWEEDGLPDLD